MIEIFIAFGAGLISFLSPCVLPLIPGYIAYISGSSLNELLEKKDVKMADAFEVKENTGFSIGGVAPVAYLKDLDVLVDKSLNRFEKVYAAAGHPHCIFEITYKELVKITSGIEKEISE